MTENEIIDLYRRLSNTSYGLYRFVFQYCCTNNNKQTCNLKEYIVNSIIMMFQKTFFSIHIWIKYFDTEKNSLLRNSIGTVVSGISDSDDLEKKINTMFNNPDECCLDGFVYLNTRVESAISLSQLNHEELVLLFRIISKDRRFDFFNTVDVCNSNRLIYKDCKFNQEITDKYEDCFYMIEYFIFSLLYYACDVYVSQTDQNETICANIRSLCDIIISAMNTIRYIETKYQKRYTNLIIWLSNTNTIEIIKIIFDWASNHILPFLK